MYNIDFSIASTITLIFLLAHYLQNRHNGTAPDRFFILFTCYVLFLSILDVANVLLLRNPYTPTGLCAGICSVYVALELFATALFTLALPVIIADVTPEERKRWRFLFIPVILVDLFLVALNPSTGLVFSIDAAHRYVASPGNIVFLFTNIFYLATMAALLLRYRRRIERNRKVTAAILLVIAGMGMVAQGHWADTRLTVLTLTLLVLEMYLGFQIPERRIDSLTGLTTRNFFYEASRRLILRHPDEHYVVIYANIEEFKAINELCGTDKGDDILATLGSMLGSYVLEAGVAGRLQGDHFAACMPVGHFDLTTFSLATSRQKMEERFGCDVHIVLGIYQIEDASMPVRIMCDRARLAMRQLGSSHVRRYAFYQPSLHADFLNDHEISTQMESALEEGCFEVYLQPLFSLATFKVEAAEALVRWNHSERGMLLPADFIPLFERNGLITELDRFVWETTCRQLRTWIDAGKEVVPISVNVSAMDLHVDMGQCIVDMVRGYDLDPGLVKFEITESAYIARHDALRRFLDCLHENGFTVVMDDFGNGYSSLMMLEEMPFDQLKIDRAFVRDVVESERSRQVVSSTISLACRLGLQVVSEGVETLEQALMLREMGSHCAQGYYFSKPMPMLDFENLLSLREPVMQVS